MIDAKIIDKINALTIINKIRSVFWKNATPWRKGHSSRLAVVSTLLLILILGFACNPRTPDSQEEPVEPLVSGLENNGDLFLRGRFSVVSPELTVYALAISSSGEEVLFSLDARSINMLDDHGRLRWEYLLEGLPVCAGLSADGRSVAVGTDQGKVVFLRDDGKTLWETAFAGEVKQLALAPGGEYLAVSVLEEGAEHKLYALDRWGTLLWEKRTGELVVLDILSDETLYCLQKSGENGLNELMLIKDGEILWELEALLASFSPCGRYAVIYSRDALHLYRLTQESAPQLLFSRPVEVEINWLSVTENGRQVLAYSAFSGGGNNLFAFHQEGFPLWEKRIPSASLLQTSRNGERIVASSWQEYSEDFSSVVVLDSNGNTIQVVEMASRIEKMALASEGGILALAGKDGDIFILDIPVPGVEPQGAEPAEEVGQDKVYYRPVIFESPGPDELYLTLYFYDQDARRLIPVSRKVKKSLSVLQLSVNELIKGPRRDSDLSRTIPKDAAINVNMHEGTALIDLPPELNKLGVSSQILGIIDSLRFTVSQFPSVEGIRFLMKGQQPVDFGLEGFSMDGTFSSPPMNANLMTLYLPYRSGERYYLLPRKAVQLGKRLTINTPENLIKVLLTESGALLPEIPELKGLNVLGNEIVLDWGSSFSNLFPPDGGPEEKARAALFLDSLLLSLAENFPPDRLVFMLEGEPWEPPPGYPSLENLALRRPFYINPE